MSKDEAVALLQGLIEAIYDGVSVNYESRYSEGYRFTFKKGSKAGEKQLADLRAMIKRRNAQYRKWDESWRPSMKRVVLKGRCGKGKWNARTMRGHCPTNEATRFDVYVLNR